MFCQEKSFQTLPPGAITLKENLSIKEESLVFALLLKFVTIYEL